MVLVLLAFIGWCWWGYRVEQQALKTIGALPLKTVPLLPDRQPRFLIAWSSPIFRRATEIQLNSAAADEDVPQVARLRWLTSATFNTDRLTDEGIAHLSGHPSLERIALGSRVTDQSIETLQSLRRLRLLGLHGSSISDNGFKRIASIHSLEILGVSEMSLSAGAVQQLAGLPRLRHVELLGCRIPPDAMKAIGQLHSVESLIIQRCPGPCGSIADLAGMKRLRWLLAVDFCDDMDAFKEVERGIREFYTARPDVSIHY